MDIKKKLRGKREHNRFPAQFGAVAVLECQSHARIGLITDISIGGLAFHYFEHTIGNENEEKSKEPYELKILWSVKEFYLEKVPCKVISVNSVLPENSFSLMPINKCSIQFGELTSDQLSLLEYFIENFTQSPIGGWTG